jgi:hypothetical protein
MPPPTTVAVFPTSEQRRGFRQWAGPRGVPTLPGNGFAVPVEILGEVPHELLLGAKVNGEYYLPEPGQVRYDAPPVEGEWIGPLEGELVASPEVVAGFPQVQADDIPTTGSPVGYEDSP